MWSSSSSVGFFGPISQWYRSLSVHEADCVSTACVSVLSPSPWACPVSSFCCCPEPPPAPRLWFSSPLLWVCAASPAGECQSPRRAFEPLLIQSSSAQIHLHSAVSTVCFGGAPSRCRNTLRQLSATLGAAVMRDQKKRMSTRYN